MTDEDRSTDIGGVDSAVAVELLHREGHDLHLFYIRIGNDTDEGDCSAEGGYRDVHSIARRYDLPFHVVSLHEEYWDSVMACHTAHRQEGLTPASRHDVQQAGEIRLFCEERWGKDFDATATGHYASVVEGWKTVARHRRRSGEGPDRLSRKDILRPAPPSYLPARPAPQERGTSHRREEVALPNARRKDSQGICFLEQDQLQRLHRAPSRHTSGTGDRDRNR